MFNHEFSLKNMLLLSSVNLLELLRKIPEKIHLKMLNVQIKTYSNEMNVHVFGGHVCLVLNAATK